VITDTVGDLFLYICIADEITENDNEPITHADQAGPINISWRRITIPKSPPSSLEYSKLLYIAIPPEFTPTVNWAEGFPETLTTNFGLGDASNIETTITNDYNMIQTGKFWPRHPVAPNWWFIRITSTPVDFPLEREDDLTKLNPAFNPKYLNSQIYRGSSGFLYPPNMDPWLDRQISQENTNGFESEFAGCYRIKIRDMKAPSCAGKYFFKVFYTSTNQPFNSLNIMQPNSSPIYGFEGGWPDLWQMPDSPYGEAYINDPWSGYLNGYFEKYDTIPPENYPVLLVKGEAEPGYISGTVRYSGHSQYYYGTYYGDGVHTSGKVVAEGTAIDPKTNEPTGRPVCATGYFLGEVPGQGQPFLDRGTGSQGLYEIEGLAPGIYTLTAYAAGFVPRTLSTQITVKTGQSIHGIDIYVYPTAKIQTRVYSKCPTGPVDFPDYVTMDGFPANEAILPVVPGGADVRGKSFNSRAPVSADGVWYWFTEGATTVQAKNLWGELMSSGVSGPITPAQLSEFVAPGGVQRIPTAKRFGWAWQELVDISGTVTAWQDFTFDLTEDRRSFNTFWGDPSCYSGVETMWDGHVPTFLADFTSGISPGNYWVRTWVFGYVQSKEYQVSFTEVDFPGTVYTEMDLFKGGTINMTVHFHQQTPPSPEMTDAQFDAVPGKNPLVIEAFDDHNGRQAWNLTDNWPWFNNFDNSRGQSLILVGDSNAWCLEGRVHGLREVGRVALEVERVPQREL